MKEYRDRKGTVIQEHDILYNCISCNNRYELVIKKDDKLFLAEYDIPLDAVETDLYWNVVGHISPLTKGLSFVSL